MDNLIEQDLYMIQSQVTHRKGHRLLKSVCFFRFFFKLVVGARCVDALEVASPAEVNLLLPFFLHLVTSGR